MFCPSPSNDAPNRSSQKKNLSVTWPFTFGTMKHRHHVPEHKRTRLIVRSRRESIDKDRRHANNRKCKQRRRRAGFGRTCLPCCSFNDVNLKIIKSSSRYRCDRWIKHILIGCLLLRWRGDISSQSVLWFKLYINRRPGALTIPEFGTTPAYNRKTIKLLM